MGAIISEKKESSFVKVKLTRGFQRSPLTHPNCQWLGCISHQYLYNSDPHKVNSPLHLTSECIPVIRSIAMVVFHIVEKLERVEKLYSMKHTLLPT